MEEMLCSFWYNRESLIRDSSLHRQQCYPVLSALPSVKVHALEREVWVFFSYFFYFYMKRSSQNVSCGLLIKPQSVRFYFTNLYEKGVNQDLTNVIYICCLVKIFIYTPSSNNQTHNSRIFFPMLSE